LYTPLACRAAFRLRNVAHAFRIPLGCRHSVSQRFRDQRIF
jgi:hypothetical protein